MKYPLDFCVVIEMYIQGEKTKKHKRRKREKVGKIIFLIT